MKRYLSRIAWFTIFFSSVSLAAPAMFRVEIEGMTCPACAEKVEEQVSKLEWVQKVTINLNEASATITVRPGKSFDEKDIRQAVEVAGYKAKGITPQ